MKRMVSRAETGHRTLGGLLDRIGTWWRLHFHRPSYLPFNSQLRCRTCTRRLEWNQQATAPYAWEESFFAREIEAGPKPAQVQELRRARIRSISEHPAYGSFTAPAQDFEMGPEAEQALIDANVLPAEDEDTVDLLEQLTIEERLVASIAVAKYRKGQVA
jgi:hypothetical protein